MNLSKEQLARQIQLHARIARVLADIAADKIIAMETALESKVAALQLDSQEDASAIHNALSRYHILLTREHQGQFFDYPPNVKYRERVQRLADRVRDKVIKQG